MTISLSGQIKLNGLSKASTGAPDLSWSGTNSETIAVLDTYVDFYET